MNKNIAATALAFPPAPTIPATAPQLFLIDERNDGVRGSPGHLHEEANKIIRSSGDSSVKESVRVVTPIVFEYAG